MAAQLSDADSQAVQCHISKMTAELAEALRFGDSISSGSIFPMPFSRSFLEIFEPYEIKHRIEAMETYLSAVSKLNGLVRPQVIEVQILHHEDRNDKLSKSMFIAQSVEVIVDHWQKLYDEVRKECDGENVSFMDGERYVHLLYDDGAFRRSRLYFWAVGCLSSFEQGVAETLWELDRFRTEVDDKSKPGIRAASEAQGRKNVYKQEMENFDRAKKRLEGIYGQLEKKRDEMKVLRDGRKCRDGRPQSRILGENVQLLAFVTIFFLHLAFSASLWSIPGVNEKYPGIMIPGAFAAVIGFITYFILFNLNLLLSGLRCLFSVPRSFLLARMANDNDLQDDSKDSEVDPDDVTESYSGVTEDYTEDELEDSSVNNSTSDSSAKTGDSF
ncbi:hypothetical protein VE03_08813 [Pseudogymnoascus sp. 23342-1-I1]|nr:hypothetical protein VE03_08813 [Pseudogymnoascus sp. 23342-1-I1]